MPWYTVPYSTGPVRYIHPYYVHRTCERTRTYLYILPVYTAPHRYRTGTDGVSSHIMIRTCSLARASQSASVSDTVKLYILYNTPYEYGTTVQVNPRTVSTGIRICRNLRCTENDLSDTVLYRYSESSLKGRCHILHCISRGDRKKNEKRIDDRVRISRSIILRWKKKIVTKYPPSLLYIIPRLAV